MLINSERIDTLMLITYRDNTLYCGSEFIIDNL